MREIKKMKRVLGMLLAVIIVTGILQFQGNASEVNAAGEKCYTIEYVKDVKIGEYYYRMDADLAALQRRKAGTKKYKTILNNIYGKCLATTKKIYYITYTQSGNDTYSTLYQCNMKGKKKEKIAKVKKSLELGAMYNQKFYVSTGNETAGYTTYTIKKDGTLKLEKKELRIYRGSKQYMVGSVSEPTDVSPSLLCIYNAKTKKKTEIGFGVAPQIVKKKVYYASYDYKNECYDIKSCALNGKKQKKITTMPKDCIYVSYICDKYVLYQTVDNDGNIEEMKKLEY